MADILPGLEKFLMAVIEAVVIAVCMALYRLAVAYATAKAAEISRSEVRTLLQSLIAWAEVQAREHGWTGPEKMQQVLDKALLEHGLDVSQGTVEVVLSEMKRLGILPGHEGNEAGLPQGQEGADEAQ